MRISLGLQIGGALGNLIDRIRLGHVTDFLDVGAWPVFNIADSSIVIGLVLLGWIFVGPGSRTGQRQPEALITAAPTGLSVLATSPGYALPCLRRRAALLGGRQEMQRLRSEALTPGLRGSRGFPAL